MTDPIAPVSSAVRPVAPVNTRPFSEGPTFTDTLKDAMSELVRLQTASAKAATDYATGKTTDVTQTLIAGEQSGIAFRLFLEVRNRAVETYQEIQRMQI